MPPYYIINPGDLVENKFIVLTGCTKGLGRSLVEGFVKAGHIVAGCGRSENLIDELQQQYGSPHQFSAIDITDCKSVQNWAENIISCYGPPDLLINNAAAMNPSKPLWEITDEEFSLVMNVNLNGTANTIRHFVPAMIEKQSGIIINLSSGWGRHVSPNVAPYCGSKWGVEGMTQALAEELPDGLAAIPLNPGIINTDMLQICFGESADKFPGPEQWGEVAVPFILNISQENNGQQLTVPIN